MALPTRDRLKRWLTLSLSSWRNHRLVDEQGRLVNEANALGAAVSLWLDILWEEVEE